MATNFLELPFDVREKVYSYLTHHQVKNFSLCSKLCRESVRYLLWSSVEIHWKSLKESLNASTLESFSYVKTLCFILDDDDHFYRHEDLGEYRCTGEIDEWEDVASSFRFILSFCDPEKLSKVVFNGFISDEGINLLRQLHRNLQNLSLTNCDHISDAGWKIIGTFPNLINLTVKGCKLDSGRLKEVVQAPCVKEVEFRCAASLDDVGMEILSHLSQLKKLVVTRSSEITELGFIELIRLEKLEEAHFYDVSLGDHALASICVCSLGLKKLHVNLCKVTDLGLMYLGNLKQLSHLTLTGFSQPISMALEYIVGLSSLEQLNVSGCTTVTDDIVTLISKSMVHLKDLNISRCIWVTDQGVIALTALKCLRQLNVSECTLLTDVALVHLKKLTTLTRLDLSGCDDFTGYGLQCLSTLDSLHDLFLRNCKGITDDNMSHLCLMQQLDFIDVTEVNQTFLTDVGLVFMSKIFSLMVVAFTWTEKVTSNGFMCLSELPLLEEVIVDIDDIPDDPFEEFCALSHMKEKAQYISVDINPVILTKNSRYWPRNGKCGLRWNCHCVGEIASR